MYKQAQVKLDMSKKVKNRLKIIWVCDSETCDIKIAIFKNVV